jgi:hypothetical protein
MTLTELTTALKTMGVRLLVRLVVDAPADAMTPEILAALADHKPLLLNRVLCGDLAGVEKPLRFTWDELSRQRWGPAVDDPNPCIVIDRPDRARMRREMEAIRGQHGDADESGLEHFLRWCDINP